LNRRPAALFATAAAPAALAGAATMAWQRGPRRIAAAMLAALGLAGCLGNSGSPTPPPTNVQAYAGDAVVSVTFDDSPLISYWLFYAQDSRITPFNLDNGTSILFNFGDVVPAYSPTILCNGPLVAVINQSNPPVQNFSAYFFTINGRTGTAKGGQGSAPVAAVPRPAAGSNVPWVGGAPLPGGMQGLGYIGLTGCGYSGRPPAGLFVAVGTGGRIYTSTFVQTVAGALTNPGNAAMTWNQDTLPSGFSADLHAVAGRAANPNNFADPGLLLVAVGNNGTILHSFDGFNWQPTSATLVNGSDLYDVAFATGGFVAVGKGGVVLNSADGVNWAVNQTAHAANPGNLTLRAVRCNASTCIAVGDSGTTLLSSDGGGSWTSQLFGVNNWTCIAYGNADANAINVLVGGTYVAGNEPINTWVVADADGNFGYLSAATGSTWVRGGSIIASGIVAMDYTSQFVALDSAGNAWMSERGTGNWATFSAAPVNAGGGAVALRSNGYGYVAMGASGANAASF